MECPKCGGGSYLSEEELVQVLNQTEPVKILIKAVYQCRACQEKFSRLVYDNLENRKKQATDQRAFYSNRAQTREQTDTEPAEGLRFF